MKYESYLRRLLLLIFLIFNFNFEFSQSHLIKDIKNMNSLIDENILQDRISSKQKLGDYKLNETIEIPEVNESVFFVNYEVSETRKINEAIKLLNYSDKNNTEKINPKLLLECNLADNYTELLLSMPNYSSKSNLANTNEIMKLKFNENVKILESRSKSSNFSFIEYMIPKFLGNILKKVKTNLNFSIQIVIFQIHNSSKTQLISAQLSYPKNDIDSNEKILTTNILKDEFLSSQSKFKYGNSFFKFKSIATNIEINGEDPINSNKEIKQLTKTGIKNLNSLPCYIKDYSRSSNMRIMSNYNNCFEMISKLVVQLLK